MKFFYWDDLYLFKYYPDQTMRGCLTENEMQSIISFCHDYTCKGHFGFKKTVVKALKYRFYWIFFLRMLLNSALMVDNKWTELLGIIWCLYNLFLRLWFWYMGNRLYGPLPNSFKSQYILVVVDYFSKWVEAVAIKSNENKVAVKFLKDNIFSWFSTLVLLLVILKLIFTIDHLKH